MDIEKIGETYTQFRSTAEQAFQLLDGVMGKMQNAADNGDSQAGEWANDLKKVAETFQGGQGQISDLLQQFHGVLSFLDQKGGGENADAKEGEGNASSNLISNLLQSDLGKSLESGALEKIGGGLLGKFFK